jgi:eukaryotic-like serine/threonine-protein kinase
VPEDKKVSEYRNFTGDEGGSTGVRPLVTLPESGEEAVQSTLPAPEDGRIRTVSIEPGKSESGDEDGVLPTVRPPAIDEEDADPYIGCVIDGRYCVESILGEGGMGVVYACKHKLIGKRVAMKVLRADMARDPEVTTRFLNEARAASAVGNPHIVDISDFGRLPDGSTYFVMEYLDGLPLSKVITPDGPVPAPRIIHIGRQLAQGLAAAHHAEIVHRDLKPDNVYLIRHGAEPDFVKILDFGIAKVSSAEGRLTRAGQVFGTPHYMSPEQSAGSAVDHRGDIYSLGVMLYEMASGHVPFDADNFLGILTQHMYKPPAPIRKTVPNAQDIPPGLEAIILKCLSKRQDQRYQAMDELVDDLDRLTAGEVPEAVRDLAQRTEEFSIPEDYFQMATGAGVGAGPVMVSRRHNWLLYTGVAGVLAAVAIVAALFAQGSLSDAARAGRHRTRPLDTAAPSIASSHSSETPSDSNVTVSPTDETTTVHQVVLATEPIDAQVFLDGKNIGSSPVLVDVVDGQTARLEIRRAGYKSREVTVNGTEGRLSVKLDRTTGVRSGRTSSGRSKRHTGLGPIDLGDPWAR